MNISQTESQWINFDSLITQKTITDSDKLGINFLLHYLLKSLEASDKSTNQKDKILKQKSLCLLAISQLKILPEFTKKIEMQIEFL